MCRPINMHTWWQNMTPLKRVSCWMWCRWSEGSRCRAENPEGADEVKDGIGWWPRSPSCQCSTPAAGQRAIPVVYSQCLISSTTGWCEKYRLCFCVQLKAQLRSQGIRFQTQLEERHPSSGWDKRASCSWEPRSRSLRWWELKLVCSDDSLTDLTWFWWLLQIILQIKAVKQDTVYLRLRKTCNYFGLLFLINVIWCCD